MDNEKKFRLIKPKVIKPRGSDLIKVVWVEHLWSWGWAEWAPIEIRIRRAGEDTYEHENKVDLNWSSVGAVNCLEADAFARGLTKAVSIAKKEEKKLFKEIAKQEREKQHASR